MSNLYKLSLSIYPHIVLRQREGMELCAFNWIACPRGDIRKIENS